MAVAVAFAVKRNRSLALSPSSVRRRRIIRINRTSDEETELLDQKVKQAEPAPGYNTMQTDRICV